MSLPAEFDDQLWGFDIHTDGSSLELWCTGCGETVVEHWSLPVDLRHLVYDALDHRCGTPVPLP